MPYSGTYTFGQEQGIDVFVEAWERVGKNESQLSANDYESARRSMAYMQGEWANRGPNLWRVELASQALTVGTATYAATTQTVMILNAYIRDTAGGQNTDYIIQQISRSDYAAQPNKAQTAYRPTQYYFQRNITPFVTLWPVQTATTVSLYYYQLLMQQDPGAMTDTPDAPQRFFDAVAAGVASRLALKWAPERYPMLKAESDRAFDLASAEDIERVPMVVLPDMRGRRY